MSRVDHLRAEDPAPPPTACPFCRSAEVTTTSKSVNVSTYWRCTACGQIWNVDRLRRGSRFNNNPYSR